MAEVYWIHLPEHTDMFTEGYIGVTRNTARSRFRGHVQSSKLAKGKNYYMTNIIKKYGKESLVVETVLIGEEDYCYEVEAKLRPSTHIGWNVAIGGVKSGNYGGYKLSEETKAKMSASRKGRKNSPEAIAKMVAKTKGVSRGPLSKESIEKREKTRFYSNMDKYADTWGYSDIWYEHFLMGLNNHFTEKLLGLKKGVLISIFMHFESGWIPQEDPLWISKFNKEADYAPQST